LVFGHLLHLFDRLCSHTLIKLVRIKWFFVQWPCWHY
jgi:hypothetical protein